MLSVGKSDPRISTVGFVMIRAVLSLWYGPLHHHGHRHGAVVQQSPGQRHGGAVDDRHTEGTHTATCPPERRERNRVMKHKLSKTQ